MENYIQVGDKVEWFCRPYGREKVLAVGYVQKVFESTIGAYKRTQVARIKIEGPYPFNRETTTIAVDKLRPLFQARTYEA